MDKHPYPYEYGKIVNDILKSPAFQKHFQEDFENASEAWSHFEDNAAGFTEEDEEDVPLSIEEYGVDFVFNEYADHWLTQETAMYIYELLSIDNHRPDINKPPFIRWHLYHAPYC